MKINIQLYTKNVKRQVDAGGRQGEEERRARGEESGADVTHYSSALCARRLVGSDSAAEDDVDSEGADRAEVGADESEGSALASEAIAAPGKSVGLAGEEDEAEEASAGPSAGPSAGVVGAPAGGAPAPAGRARRRRCRSSDNSCE